MCNFRIGQEVVCTITHSQGFVKKGEIHKIHALQSRLCGCPGVLVDVGLRNDNPRTRCTHCGALSISGGTVWICATLFAPIQTDSEEADMEEALAEVSERELFA